MDGMDPCTPCGLQDVIRSDRSSARRHDDVSRSYSTLLLLSTHTREANGVQHGWLVSTSPHLPYCVLPHALSAVVSVSDSQEACPAIIDVHTSSVVEDIHLTTMHRRPWIRLYPGKSRVSNILHCSIYTVWVLADLQTRLLTDLFPKSKCFFCPVCSPRVAGQLVGGEHAHVSTYE